MYKIKDSLLETQANKEKSDFSFIITVLFLALVMAVIIFFSQVVFLNVSVSGQSMEPTLHNNDMLIANRIKQSKKGDIVIISGEKSYWLVKRVIATGGDEIMFEENGYVYINGEKYKDKFGQALHLHHNVQFEIGKTYLLEEDEIFYLGDNRNASSDSRDLGTCRESQIVGVVENWSINNDFLNTLYSFGQKIKKLIT
jgi:signal peptidase I